MECHTPYRVSVLVCSFSKAACISQWMWVQVPDYHWSASQCLGVSRAKETTGLPTRNRHVLLIRYKSPDF